MTVPESSANKTKSAFHILAEGDKGAWLRIIAGLAMLGGAAAYVGTEASGQEQILVIVIAGVVGEHGQRACARRFRITQIILLEHHVSAILPRAWWETARKGHGT